MCLVDQKHFSACVREIAPRVVLINDVFFVFGFSRFDAQSDELKSRLKYTGRENLLDLGAHLLENIEGAASGRPLAKGKGVDTASAIAMSSTT